MIYFKFPFDEKIHTINENLNQKALQFLAFDQNDTIEFNGNIEEIKRVDFEKLKISSENLPKQSQHFSSESKDEYIDKLKKTINIIKDHHLPKIVLSRRKIITQLPELNLNDSFLNLVQTYPNAFAYLFIKNNDAWMGAFSEILGKFNKKTNLFETMSLAGTIPVNDNWSEKEIEEQKPVSNYIKNILSKYVSNIEQSDTYDHISGNIKHLRTDFKAYIESKDLDNIIKELHPTPAVCGIPKDFCKDTIASIEKFPREFYAGYIKIETEDFIQYFVNLRCAKLYKDAIHLFVGGGITSQSDPEKEWKETELKSEAVFKNLSYLQKKRDIN